MSMRGAKSGELFARAGSESRKGVMPGPIIE